MHRLARFLDPRNTIEGKIVSVILSVVLVFSMVNLSTIVENASAAGSDGDALFTTELATDDKAKTQTEGGEPTQNQVITDEQPDQNTTNSNQPSQNNNGVATLSLDDDQNSDESNNAQSASQKQQQRAAAAPAVLANSEITIKVNESTELTSTRSGNYYDTWEVNNSKVLEINSYDKKRNQKKTNITGKSEGTAVITHTWYTYYYGYWKEGSETFNVTVEKAAPQGSQLTYFYFLLPGKDSKVDTAKEDYMYAGNGYSKIPVNLGERWYQGETYNGSNFDIKSYVTEWPTDSEIREGLAAYYNGANGRDTYNSSWTYTYVPLVMTSSRGSVGYDYGDLNPKEAYHIDIQLVINKNDKATIGYQLTNPNGEKDTRSVEHPKETTVEINSTVSKNQNFTTDGALYEPTKEYAGKIWYFDGWYTDEGYTNKAPDQITVNDSAIYYAHYVTKTPADDPEKGIKLATIPAEKPYDGTALKANAATATGAAEGEVLAIEYSLNGTDWVTNPEDLSITNVSETTKVQVRASGNNYEGYATAEVDLKITPREVTLTSAPDTKVYDGTALTKPGVTVTDDVFNAEATAEATGTITNVGKQPNTIEVKGIEGKPYAESNYKFTKNEGELEITAQSPTDPDHGITLNATSAEKPYDGTALKANAATATGAAEGEVLAIEYSLNGTDWVTNPEDLSITNVSETTKVQVRASGNNYEGYATAEVDLKITPREVTLTSAPDTKVYDGTALTKPGVTVTDDVFNAEATAEATGTITNVGKQPNTIEVKGIEGKPYAESNYKFTKNEGELEITAQSIDPTDPTEPTDDPNQPVYNGVQVSTPTDVIYNGQIQNQPIQVTDTDGNALPEDAYTVTYTDAVNVGTVTVTITGQGNYAGQVTRTYQITPAALTVTTPSATKTFDGVALTNTAGTLEGMQGNDSVVFTVNGTQTAVGNSVNTYAIDWNNALASNYTIVENLGTLTVNAAPVAPVTPVTPAPTPAPAGPGAPAVAPGVPTPAAAAAAAPLAAPVATITDDATPLAAGETIDDEDTPLAAFDHVDCWVHWFILVGIILTAIYGAVVVRRRLTVVKDVDDLEDEVLDGAVAGATQSAPADNRQAI